MGCFCVVWPSSQCCSKLRNHRHRLSSTITLMVIKAQPGTAKITYMGGKYCFGSPCKIFPLKYSLYYNLDSSFVFFLFLFLLVFPTVTKIILTSFFAIYIIYIYREREREREFICLVCPSFIYGLSFLYGLNWVLGTMFLEITY